MTYADILKEERRVDAMIVDNKYWNADNGDGTYTNPVLYTDYSDPDVCRVGEDYFMVASSFCNAPGLPILHSKDLVNWELINYAIDKVPGEQFAKPRHGCGVWAPAIRYHEGEYIIFFPMPDEGIYVVKTKDPWGKWDEPTCLYQGKGWIDPCPFWDEDGKAYMVSAFAKSRIGFKSILHLCEITPDCLHMIGEGKHIFDGNQENQVTIEGPKMYKRNGYYYIFAPAGGVKQGWQVVMRSKNIWGPYEYKNVLMQKDTPVNGPHQGAWVTTPSGEDWFLHFQDVYAAGRIVHLQPFTWENDWPVFADEKPVMTYKKPNVGKEYPKMCVAAEDDFTNDQLGLQWQWNANPQSGWYTIDKDNHLTLYAVQKEAASIADIPNLLLQKWHMPEFTAVTKMRIDNMQVGDVAGVINMGVAYGALGVQKTENGTALVRIYGEQQFDKEQAFSTDKVEIVTYVSENTKELFLALEVKKLPSVEENTEGPYAFPIPREEVILSYSLDGQSFMKAYSFEAKAGRWVGAKEGLFCFHEGIGMEGYVQVSYFHFGDNVVYSE